jgi:hypothetical protein
MTEDLRTTLTASLDEATWEWLIPHYDRGVIITVDPSLNLVDVGMAIAQDQTQPVQHWLAEQLLNKPSPAQCETWAAQVGLQFVALIVQPYVLIQEKSA